MADLPNREHAYVEESKLTEYLLSQSHTIGKSKAQFFNAAGFDRLNVDALAQALVQIAATQTVVDVIPTEYGSKYGRWYGARSPAWYVERENHMDR